ncbi:stage III sporulation protein AF [Terrilactibacillus sp. BCM23-1]|uniref:Stage III sporulation protein AF n=1 Tax=Terrilactibacillus tamarindi TaxID=2599694 RepID=A0A6N8CRL3_9BACI|nr:stage III sporulation protein AF [Terrilactibacillus tamarindi]MTT32681.1 stage III sporulation protein AF [Terrilactibacillus tamarindi]
MSYLINWLTHVIFIVFFAIILDMLLPAKAFQKYVKLVIGLVIIVSLLDPLLKILHVDMDQAILKASMTNDTSQTKNLINTNKSEIESEQAAYIHNTLVNKMKNYVKEALVDRYGLEIKQLKVKTSDDTQNTLTVDQVAVVVGQTDPRDDMKDTKDEIKPVDHIQVDISNSHSTSENKIEAQEHAEIKKVRQFLAKEWGIDEKVIQIQKEGGE